MMYIGSKIKNNLTCILWILLILVLIVNEVSYNNASLTKNAEYTVSIHSFAGYTRRSPGGTAKYVTPQEGFVDQIATQIGIVLIIIIGIRSWLKSKSKAPILFPNKDLNKK